MTLPPAPEIFSSVHEAPVAQVQFGINLAPYVPKRKTAQYIFDARYSAAVQVIHSYPLEHEISIAATAKAIISRGLQEGQLPKRYPISSTVPVIMLQQPTMYHIGSLPSNVIMVPQCIWPVLLAKVMIGVAITESIADLREFLNTNQHSEYFDL
jgi:hypothetical protein